MRKIGETSAIIIAAAIFSLMLFSSTLAGSTKVTKDGIQFPDGTTQTTSSTGGSGKWSTSGFDIYYNSGNVGIGKANPAEKLEVNGNIEVSGDGNGIKFPDGTIQTTAYLFSSAPVPKSGQSTSYGNRDDGELERGVMWPTPRFTDNGNGTVLDNLTGLIWTKNANCDGAKDWTTALAYCNALSNGTCGLTDGSEAGDWRLPQIEELQSLIDYGEYTPALPSGHPFASVQSNVYWSSTTISFSTGKAWYVNLDSGSVFNDVEKASSRYFWPVRGGN